jgi:hypothetical protein
LLSDSSVLSWENLPARVFGNLVLILKVVTKYFSRRGLDRFSTGGGPGKAQSAREGVAAGWKKQIPFGKDRKKGRPKVGCDKQIPFGKDRQERQTKGLASSRAF